MSSPKKIEVLRGALAALIGSKMSAADLRLLVKSLEDDAGFRRALARGLYETLSALDVQPSFEWDTSDELTPSEGEDGLVSLVSQIVQRKRMSKRDLVSLIGRSYAKIYPELEDGDTARVILRKFFSAAPTSARQRVLKELGVEVSVDPYLGGISNRT
ncbi:hypothetical protein KCU57_17955 [Xanthomonas translucens]|uniref:hypothetical protein n=1 Tax=Xanthomonas campestris pv. translucens TaxID=343 RepID=UPI001F2C3AE3|nr:hypothetical protein [Xanthomonas translucens]UKE50525.1 hypothetical protein KCU57_17955 [Xanthomonas translucens]